MALVEQKTAGSIGLAWPPRHDEHNDRIKGFCTCIINDRTKLAKLLYTADKAQETKNTTRTTVRAFVKNSLLEGINRMGPYEIEAVVPVSNALSGYDMVYFGRNAPERLPPDEVANLERRSVARILELAPVSSTTALERAQSNNFGLSFVHGAQPMDVARLDQLYHEAYSKYTFEISPQTISDMLSNGNVVSVGRDINGSIVSSMIAEHCILGLENGKEIHLYELSDFATFRQYRGKGLMTAMQRQVIDKIRSLPHGKEAIIYAEDRAAWEAVNISSRKAGLEYGGRLPLHCVLVSDRSFGEQGIYESLNVWYAR